MLGRKRKALQKSRSADFNPDFVFTEKGGAYDGSWALADVMSQLKKKVRLTAEGSRWPWPASPPFPACLCLLELIGQDVV